MPASQDDDRIPNLGPVSRGWLSEVGIHSLADLQATGPLAAYLMVSRRFQRTSLNLLWALVAATSNRDWREVSPREKDELRKLLRELGGA